MKTWSCSRFNFVFAFKFKAMFMELEYNATTAYRRDLGKLARIEIQSFYSKDLLYEYVAKTS